ncbi:YrbL family protein [Yoonia sediminilitoris]|uniref:PhoP regulatory network protein YrbL n=1 Tax=Yoonia sediminilitoris TaxID=1286148 RepID=A0A2T6KI45_9RHOB|nr:YrbL family protein [Yoonia sediminilitoris]PUB15406.1 PhoP regulatory network protein YrbL [Yoonia sediminilitoris]RCW96016.1 PhoP regulatory network protein YrbL [Yoonia sediminilitoris]
MSNPLFLDPDDFVASGVQRVIYYHPKDKTRLIKILKATDTMPMRRNFGGILEKLVPSTRLRLVSKEYTEYLRIMLSNPAPSFHLPIAHMYGFIQTTIGLGCLTERVMKPDGALGDTLLDKVRSDSLSDADLELLNDMIQRIYNHHIRASDFNPKNFVFGQRDNGTGLGPKECVMVDGFGDIHALPVRSMAKWSNRIGLDDGCKRISAKTGLAWDKHTKLFSRTSKTPARTD